MDIYVWFDIRMKLMRCLREETAEIMSNAVSTTHELGDNTMGSDAYTSIYETVERQLLKYDFNRNRNRK